jgi:hypothetical protein
MAAMDSAAFTKQGELKTLGGFSNSEWQTRSVALKSGQPPMLLFSQASCTFGSSASSSHVDGCIALSPSSAAAATPGTSTDFTLTNVEHAHNAVLGLQSLDLRAETERARDEWVAAINAEIRRATGSGGAAAAPASPSAPVVYSFKSLDQELLGAATPPADVIDLGRLDENGKKRDGFRELTLEDQRLLLAKMHSSPALRELNINGTLAAEL